MFGSTILCLVAFAVGDDSCPQEYMKHGCTEPSKAPAGCTPRRCCGRPEAGPVMQGVDFVDLYACNVEQGRNQEECLPQFAGGEHAAKLNDYSFWFLNASNQARFEQEPKKFAPQIGGYCAFSPSGYDVTGAGLWCSCPTSPTEGYTFVNNKSYWFLFQHAHDRFIKFIDGGYNGSSVENVHRNWDVLLEENSAEDWNCFNTNRFVPTDTNGKCLLSVCRSYRHCADCPPLTPKFPTWLA